MREEDRYGVIKFLWKAYQHPGGAFIFLAILLLSDLHVVKAQAQIYPVSVTTQITPPYSVNLSDYVAPGCEQLKVIIVQRDLTQAPYRLYLKMEIELNGKTIIRTSSNYIPSPFTLEPGIPTLISGSSLASFFDPANMEFTAYSREQYMRTKILPEGAYVITFTAYDWTRRDVALSHGGAFFCYLAKTGPPLLNLPLNNAFVTKSSPQYINFQWLPGTTSSPNSALSTKYRFELFEMRTGGMSPSEIVTSTRPIFVSETERTNLVYSISEPALENGMRYVWRVKAYDILGRDFIRNNGLSEVFSFVYGEGERGTMEFSEIGNFTAAALSPRKAKLNWDASDDYSSYKVFYRKKGNENKWYETETVQKTIELNGLSPGVIYECRVQGRNMNAWGSFSRTVTVLMPVFPVLDCGSPFTPLNVTNREPLRELMRLQEFDAGGFMVTVIDPYALTTQPGRFTGRGFVQVPIFGHKKIRCEFTDIFINTDLQMVEGSIRLLCDHAEGKNAIWDVDEVFEGGSDNGTVIEGTEEVSIMIPDVVIADEESVLLDTVQNEILVITESNDTLSFDVAEKMKEKSGSLTVQDSGGNLYSIDTKTGKAASIGKVPPPGSPQQLAASLPTVIDDRKGKVNFEPVPGVTRFAFDRRNTQYAGSNLFTEVYKTMNTADGELYDIPYKLIPVGETDVVLAKADIKRKSLDPDSIIFRSGLGTIYKRELTRNKGEYLLTLPSGKANDGIDIFATYTDNKGKTFVLGKMIVLTYAVRRPQLTLVPVNGNGEDIDPAIIKAELDKVYLPVAVDWQVTIDKSNFTATADSLNIKGSGLFSQYTDGMKKLNSEFVLHKKESFDPTAVYLYMLRVSGEESATGDMPLSRQFGYIFTRTAMAGGEEAFYRTIAHEIAHGAFSLSHTFDSKYDIPEKTTTNLLDYTAGTDLVKHQWDAIHNPGLVIGMFERDEEGMMKKRRWDNIIQGSISELGINPGYFIRVNEFTGETVIITEEYIILEQQGNQHLKLLDIIRIYEFKCPPENEFSEEYFSKSLGQNAQTKLLSSFCQYYPHSMHEFRILCETWLTNSKTIFINGELEGTRGKDFSLECPKCKTPLAKNYFLEPDNIMNYAESFDPLVLSYFEVLKSNARRIINDDIRYKELTLDEIKQTLIELIPNIADVLWIDKPTPYGGFGPSYFINKKIPNIDTENTFYIKLDKINDAIKYFNKLKNERYFDPNNIILN